MSWVDCQIWRNKEKSKIVFASHHKEVYQKQIQDDIFYWWKFCAFRVVELPCFWGIYLIRNMNTHIKSKAENFNWFSNTVLVFISGLGIQFRVENPTYKICKIKIKSKVLEHVCRYLRLFWCSCRIFSHLQRQHLPNLASPASNVIYEPRESQRLPLAPMKILWRC